MGGHSWEISSHKGAFVRDPKEWTYPTVCNCGTPPVLPTSAFVMDCALATMIQRYVYLLEYTTLGFSTASPEYIVVFTARAFSKWRLHYMDVGHVECGYPLVHPNACLFEKRDVILDVFHDISHDQISLI